VGINFHWAWGAAGPPGGALLEKDEGADDEFLRAAPSGQCGRVDAAVLMDRNDQREIAPSAPSHKHLSHSTSVGVAGGTMYFMVRADSDVEALGLADAVVGDR